MIDDTSAVFDRGLVEPSKGSAIEPGHLQQMNADKTFGEAGNQTSKAQGQTIETKHPQQGAGDEQFAAQVLESPRKYVTSANKRNKDWTEANRTSGKNKSPGIQNQVLTSNTIGVSNSFDSLGVKRDHDVKKAGNKVQ